MKQEIINLYDECTHKPLKRSEFLRRLVLLTGSTAAAMAMLPLIEVNHAHAAVTPLKDLFTESITYTGRPQNMIQPVPTTMRLQQNWPGKEAWNFLNNIFIDQPLKR